MTSVEDPSLADIHIVRREAPKRPENSDDEARTTRKYLELKNEKNKPKNGTVPKMGFDPSKSSD